MLFATGTSAGSFFYREYVPADKSYRLEKIKEASDIDEACEMAVKIAFKFHSEAKYSDVGEDTSPYLNSFGNNDEKWRGRRRLKRIQDACSQYLDKEHERLKSGLIKDSTFENKKKILERHIVPYLSSKAIKHTQQINHLTFADYLVYRSQTTALMRQREVGIISEWVFRHLLPNNLLDSVPSKQWFPKVRIKQTDRLKNPAINPDDWRLIVDYIREDWRHSNQECGQRGDEIRLWRSCFWHYILLSKNTGMSPEEVFKLQWKQIEINDVGRTDTKGQRQEWLVAYIRTTRSKTSALREIVCNQGRELKRWMAILKEYCSEHDIKSKIGPSTLVFGDPYNKFTSHPYVRYYRSWSEMRNKLKDKFKGHRFSPHPYTLYSMRSTFIEDHLLKGTDLFLLARLAGHDVKELMKSYERLDIRNRTEEITAIQFGKKKEEEFIVDLMNEEQD
ncbi:phage integrase family protein [Synechococcus sp. A18-46.1]|nr:phage integrase family protein [Synechococcus sp. A18-46.1]